jgi:hypothetical protein
MLESSSQEFVKLAPDAQLVPVRGSRGDRRNPASPLVQLTARLFFRDSAPRVIALVSCRSCEDVTSLGCSFRDFLSSVGAKAVLMQAADCLVWPRGRTSLPAGTFGSGPTTSENFLAAKEECDVLLVDCGSLEGSPAVFMLAAHVDGVVLVVEDGQHSAGEMRKAVHLIKGVNGVVLGIVLTNRKRNLPSWFYNFFSRSYR